MLSSIRNNRKVLSIVLWFVIIAFVSTIFVVWGVGEKNTQLSYVAKVGKDVVSYEDYNNLYQQTQAELSRFGGQIKIDNLEAKILDSAIINRLLLQEAARLKIPVTDVEVKNAVESNPAFQINGAFDYKQYETILKHNRLTAAAFEQRIREDIQLNKLRLLIYQTQSTVSDAEVEKEYNYRKSNVEVEYASIPLEKFSKNYKPTEKELKKFYEFVKGSHTVPSEIKVKYIEYDYDEFNKNFVVSDEDAQNYYNNNKQKYEERENADVDFIHVVTPFTADNATLAKAKESIDKAYSELQANNNFSNVAKKYTTSTMTDKDGKYGKVYRGVLADEYDRIIFSTKPGTYSKPTKISNGYIIVKVNSLNPQKTSTFEEKKNEIKKEIKDAVAKNEFNAYVLDEYRKIMDSGNIAAYQAVAKDKKIEVKETGFIKENGEFPIVAVAINSDLKNSLYNQEIGGVVKADDGSMSYIIELVERKDKYIPDLKDIKDVVEAEFIGDKLIKDGVKELTDEISKNGFEKTVIKYNATKKVAKFNRDEIENQEIVNGNQEVIKALKFAKKGEDIKNAFAYNGKLNIYRVNSVTAPNKDDLEKNKEIIANSISAVKGNAAVENFVTSLKNKNKGKIVYNKEFLKSNNIILFE